MSPILWDILQWLALLIALLLFYWLWQQMSQSWEDEKRTALGGSGSEGSSGNSEKSGDSEFSGDADSGGTEDFSDFDDSSMQKARRRLLKEILKRDPKLGKYISELAGKGSQDITELDDAGLDEVAQSLGDELLAIFFTATQNIPIDLDLDSRRTSLEEVRAGGIYRDLAPMRSLDQLPSMSPEDMTLPPSVRKMRFATGQMRRVRNFNLKSVVKLLYILRDRSGSMTEEMRDQLSKDIWARGVVLKYAMRAQEGKTRFYYRDFDEYVKDLQKVLTVGDVKDFIRYLRTHPAPENAGTDILNAIIKSVADILGAKEEHISSAEIVLISDGADNSVSDPDVVRKALKGIKLHVIMIGAENLSLKEVATTYIVV